MKRSIDTIFLFLVCFCYVTTAALPAGASSGASLTELAATVTAEWFTDHEPAGAVTRDLTLALPASLAGEGITADFASSNSAVLAISGDTGAVTRDAYADQTITLTVTLKRGSETAEKKLSLTVLSRSTRVYMSESFYYPDYEGQLLTNVTPIVDGMGISSSTSSIYGGGWSSTYQTSLDETTTNGRRFKTVLEQADNEYCLYSYRKEAFEEYNYTKYVFKDKPTGKAEMSVRLKFAETEPNQIYLFQLWANYLLSSGSLKRAKPIEVQFHRRSTGHYVTLNGQGIVHEAIPETGEWFTCRIAFDLEAQTYDFYINQIKINTDPIDFYDKGDADHADCQSINDFHFNSYRTYGGGAVYLDDMIVKSDNSYYENNQHKLLLADLMDFSEIAFYDDESSVSADSVTDSFTLNLTKNSDVAALLAEQNLSVDWDTSNASILSVSGSSVTVMRSLLTKKAVLTAKIQQNGDGVYVEKPYELTIPCLSGTETLNAAYQALRAETMTRESPFEVT
ncbi:MAG: immunoglobulin-like domain-containing protein, partial [Clostridia bacterium]